MNLIFLYLFFENIIQCVYNDNTFGAPREEVNLFICSHGNKEECTNLVALSCTKFKLETMVVLDIHNPMFLAI